MKQKKSSAKHHSFYVHTELLVSQPISRVLSWTAIHLGQMSPPASSNLPVSDAGHVIGKPIWSCSERGLPCHRCYQRRGALLPHPFTLTCFRTRTIGGLLSAALSVGFRPPGVTWHSTLWSPDFPLCNTLRICKQKSEKSAQRLSSQLTKKYTTGISNAVCI